MRIPKLAFGALATFALIGVWSMVKDFLFILDDERVYRTQQRDNAKRLRARKTVV